MNISFALLFFLVILQHIRRRMMRTIFYPAEENAILEGRYTATIGFFDGVHLGHRFLIHQLKETASTKEQQTMVITFERHPRQVLHSDWQPQLLTSLKERIDLIEQAGIDVIVVLRFDETMARLSAREFMQQVLHDHLHVSTLLTGYDNRFGHDRTEGFADYVEYGQQMGLEVIGGTPYNINNQNISSSLIRRLLTQGAVAEAIRCLGRPYSLSGLVVHGEQIGRQLGFPTANIQPDSTERLVPATGVYAVNISIEGYETTYQGMMNIGTRPTFEGHQKTLEVNIFEFQNDIYGKRLRVYFLDRIRSEQHFNSADELVNQMKQDKNKILHTHYEKGA
jgi:riboflavin kinase/FMN adenylyltransferase